MTPEQVYEKIILKIDLAIDTENGEQRELKATTEAILSQISDDLVEALGLPANHHL